MQEDYRRYVVMQKQAEHAEYHGVKVHRYVTRWQDWQNCSAVPENEEYYQCDTPQYVLRKILSGRSTNMRSVAATNALAHP